MRGAQSIFRVFFVLAKLATSSIRVNSDTVPVSQRQSYPTRTVEYISNSIATNNGANPFTRESNKRFSPINVDVQGNILMK